MKICCLPSDQISSVLSIKPVINWRLKDNPHFQAHHYISIPYHIYIYCTLYIYHPHKISQVNKSSPVPTSSKQRKLDQWSWCWHRRCHPLRTWYAGSQRILPMTWNSALICLDHSIFAGFDMVPPCASSMNVQPKTMSREGYCTEVLLLQSVLIVKEESTQYECPIEEQWNAFHVWSDGYWMTTCLPNFAPSNTKVCHGTATFPRRCPKYS